MILGGDGDGDEARRLRRLRMIAALTCSVLAVQTTGCVPGTSSPTRADGAKTSESRYASPSRSKTSLAPRVGVLASVHDVLLQRPLLE
jgi:hypothetical protein